MRFVRRRNVTSFVRFVSYAMVDVNAFLLMYSLYWSDALKQLICLHGKYLNTWMG